MPDFSVIIPAYNEEKTVGKAILETLRVLVSLGKTCEIIVVDDGSTDCTAGIVENLANVNDGLRLIRHAGNQGKGAAVKTGVLAARGEWLVFFDSDLATHPSEIGKAIPFLGNRDIIIGSRRVTGADIAERQPLHRHWFGRLFNLLIRHYLALPYHDTQCGFKLFQRKTIPLFVTLRSRGWTFDVELLYLAKKFGFKVQEIPVTWRNGRESRVRVAHAVDIVRELRRIKRGDG